MQLYNKTATVVSVVLHYYTLAAIQSGDIRDIEIWGKVTLKGENEQAEPKQGKGKRHTTNGPGNFLFRYLTLIATASLHRCHG